MAESADDDLICLCRGAPECLEIVPGGCDKCEAWRLIPERTTVYTREDFPVLWAEAAARFHGNPKSNWERIR